MRSEIYERNQNRKESQDMQYQDDSLDMREGLTSDSVDDDGKRSD